MSRLRALTVPFLQGENDGVSPQILPDGVLADLRNGRFNKAGELALRRGWRPIPTTGLSGAAWDLYSVDQQLLALNGSGSQPVLATLLDSAATRPWQSPTFSQSLPLVTDVQTRGGVTELTTSALRASAALTPDGVFGCVLVQTSTQTVFRVFRVDSDATIVTGTLTTANSLHFRKVLGVSGGFGMVECQTSSGGAVLYSTLNPLATSPAWGGGGTMVAAGAHTFFDAVTARVVTPGAVHLARVTGGDVFYSRHDVSSGALLGATTKTVGTTLRVACAVASDDVTSHVVSQDSTGAGGDLVLLSFSSTPPYTTAAGPTSLFSGGAIFEKAFSVAYESNRVQVAGQQAIATVPDDDVYFDVLVGTTHALAEHTERGIAQLTGGCVAFSVRGGFGISRDRAMLYGDRFSPWVVLEYGTGSTVSDLFIEPPFAPGSCAAGLWLLLGRQQGQDGVTYPAVRLARIGATTRRPAAVMAGVLYLAGGIISQFAGYEFADNGMLQPMIRALVPSNGAGLLTPSSAYQYRLVFAWVDSGGREHRSIVSTASDVSTGVGEDTMTLSVYAPPTLRRARDLVGDPWVEVYRTEAGPGELFYLTKSQVNTSATFDVMTIVDTSSDASLLDNRRLYTEGDTGATSGVLDATPALPTRYLAATRDRLVAAGPGAAYQLSQLVFPGGVVEWTQPGVSGPAALVYFDSVEGEINAVATLDDTIVIGTDTALYVTSANGSGTPNLAGVGEFESPARLPSNVGFYDWRSIVETAEGLWFLGDVDKLFLLPRGEGSPQWAGESVQDRLAGGVVGAARDTIDHVVAWAVAGGSPALVVRDLQNFAWSGDPLPFTPVAFVSHQGRFYAVANDGVVWENSAAGFGDGTAGAIAVVLRATTGDVQAFGALDGWGRLGGITLEGVFQTAAALLVEVSYDQGLTWTSLGAHTVTGLAVGEAFQRQWYPANQRGGRFRLRVTMTPSVTTTEGCRLNGFTLHYTTRSGPARLATAKRR